MFETLKLAGFYIVFGCGTLVILVMAVLMIKVSVNISKMFDVKPEYVTTIELPDISDKSEPKNPEKPEWPEGYQGDMSAATATPKRRRRRQAKEIIDEHHDQPSEDANKTISRPCVKCGQLLATCTKVDMVDNEAVGHFVCSACGEEQTTPL